VTRASQHVQTQAQEFHQEPSLFECRLSQSLPHPPAEVLDGAGKPGELLLPVRLRLELSRLSLELALALLEVTPAPSVFVQGSGKKLGRYAANWIACWPKRPSSTAART
jgi:hypothetical protein